MMNLHELNRAIKEERDLLAGLTEELEKHYLELQYQNLSYVQRGSLITKIRRKQHEAASAQRKIDRLTQKLEFYGNDGN